MSTYIVYLGIALLVVTVCYLLMITPNLTGKHKASFLQGKNISHRGLYSNTGGIPENSIEAARKSVLCGFGIEFDVRLSGDGEVMVFHDDDLDRMTDHKGAVSDYTRQELQQISLLGTNQTIPTLSQYLKIANGKVPLVVELKGGYNNTVLCEKVSEILDEYCGNFVVESFHPDIVIWFKKNRPNYIRGQLSAAAPKGAKNRLARFALAYLLTNFLSKPHFIAYRHQDTNNLSFRICKSLGAMTMGWTIDNLSDYKKATMIFDTIIFEKILPANDYLPACKGDIRGLSGIKSELPTNTKTQNVEEGD